MSEVDDQEERTASVTSTATSASESGIDEWTGRIREGDAFELLEATPKSSVHCCVTSPPYWGMRDYAVNGQLGLEPSLEAYVQRLVDFGEKLRRVLREDGSWWLNLGDGYSGSGGAGGQWNEENRGTAHINGERGEAYDGPLNESALPRKSKLLVPHRVAIALQKAGWIVRHDIPWVKKSTPDPAADRLRSAHEIVFHLVPQPNYWHNGAMLDEWGVFDAPPAKSPEAHTAVFPEELPKVPIRGTCPPEVCADCGSPLERITQEVDPWKRETAEIDRRQLRRAMEIVEQSDLTTAHLRACRSYGFSDAGNGRYQSGAGANTDEVQRLAREAKAVLGGYFREFATVLELTATWDWTCDCATDATASGIVLDPFAGSGTTCVVAREHDRRYIGFELKPEFVQLARKRLSGKLDRTRRARRRAERATRAARTDGYEQPQLNAFADRKNCDSGQ